jgi:putative ABC transport system ATP-binding protein
MGVLAVEHLGRRFSQERWLFQGLHFTLQGGEQLALRGESGVGKSTLLHLIAGLDRPDCGRVMWDAQDIAQMAPAAQLAWRKRTLGFVFQAFHLKPHLSATQNVALPCLLADMPLQAALDRARSILDRLGVGARADALPGDLSGGEQQRVALARALVHGPELVLADEPTGNLDPQTASQALDLLCEICRHSGASLLMVTHSGEAAAKLDRCLELNTSGLEQVSLR